MPRGALSVAIILAVVYCEDICGHFFKTVYFYWEWLKISTIILIPIFCKILLGIVPFRFDCLLQRGNPQLKKSHAIGKL